MRIDGAVSEASGLGVVGLDCLGVVSLVLISSRQLAMDLDSGKSSLCLARRGERGGTMGLSAGTYAVVARMNRSCVLSTSAAVDALLGRCQAPRPRPDSVTCGTSVVEQGNVTLPFELVGRAACRRGTAGGVGRGMAGGGCMLFIACCCEARNISPRSSLSNAANSAYAEVCWALYESEDETG